jgi:uncharacterized protein (TIRG00374 family)
MDILLTAVSLNLIYLIIKSFRWRLLLPQYPMSRLLKLSFICQFYTIFSFGQFMGEAAKIYILGKGGEDSGQIAMSVLIDKICGIIGPIIVAIFGLVFTKTILPKSLILAFISTVIICLTLIFSIKVPLFYLTLKNLLLNWLKRSRHFTRFINFIIKIIEAWHIYSRQIRIILAGIFLSITLQLIAIVIYMVLSSSFAIEVSFFDWCWLSSIISGLSVLPITIGGIGVREGSLVGLLGFFAIASEKALALSFSFFSIQLLFAVIGGIIEMRRVKMFKLMQNNN